jgi:uncharacterized protein (DUF1499 family)
MFRPGLSVFLSLLLAIGCWFSVHESALAQTVQIRSTPALVMFSGGTALFSFAGTRPTNLGVKQGQLLACPNTPNCVNSQSSNADQKVEPLTFSSSPAQALANLKSVIQTMPRTRLVTEESNYLYAEFTTALMGFVDDVEFYIDEAARVVHVRSASRLGQSDLGVNRKRVEEIRAKFAAIDSQA